jgi:hypothetical protein
LSDRRLALGLLLIGLALLAWSFVPGYGPQYTVFAETQLNLTQTPDAPITQVTYQTSKGPGAPKPLMPVPPDEDTVPDGEAAFSLKGLQPNWYVVSVVRTAQEGTTTSEMLDLQILHTQYGFMAAAGALLAVLAAPLVLIQNTRLYSRRGTTSTPLTGWVYLLMEPTGLSLARLQLILLFVPAAVAYLALSFPLHEFPHLPDSIWQLLGIGGATAALSTLIAPKGGHVTLRSSLPLPDSYTALAQTATDQQASALAMPTADSSPATAAPAPAPATAASATAPPPDAAPPIYVNSPSMTDLFADESGFGDISRYQSFVMCTATAIVFIVSFFDTWSMPAIPDEILQLLGMSLAVYLGVKGIKVIKQPSQ